MAIQIYFTNVENNWNEREAYPFTKIVSKVTPPKKIVLDKSIDDWSIKEKMTITIIKIVLSKRKSTSFG